MSIQQEVKDAIATGRAIHIKYEDSDGNKTNRQIVPTRIQPRAGSPWLVVAFDIDKQEPRNFRLNRISYAGQTPEPARKDYIVVGQKNGAVYEFKNATIERGTIDCEKYRILRFSDPGGRLQVPTSWYGRGRLILSDDSFIAVPIP